MGEDFIPFSERCLDAEAASQDCVARMTKSIGRLVTEAVGVVLPRTRLVSTKVGINAVCLVPCCLVESARHKVSHLCHFGDLEMVLAGRENQHNNL